VKEHRASYYGAAVYGSVLAAALLGAMREQHVGPRELTLSLVASMLVFWLAHAWSELIGERVAAGRLFDETRIRQIARAEWPLVEAAIVPAIALALAWAGLWSRTVGVDLALAATILQLVGWGAVAARRTEPSWVGAVLMGAVEGALGLAIVALELAIH
jgi:hypothetical protein